MEGLPFIHPLHGPFCLFLDHVNVFDGLEQVLLFVFVLDVGVDEEGVGFGVDVLHGDLETVKAAGFGDLNFGAELLGEVFEDDAVAGGEEG